MTELLALAKQYFDELNKLLPDTPSDTEAIRLTQTLRKCLDDSAISNDSDLIDAIDKILKACRKYKTTHKNENHELLAVLKIELKCILFLSEAEKNTHFWNRHKGKIIAGFCLLCVVIGIVLVATGVGSPLALFLGLFGVQLTIGLPALYAATSGFCLAVGLIVSGIVIGLEKLIGYFLPSKKHSYLSSPDMSPSSNNNTNPIFFDDGKNYRPGGSSFSQGKNHGFTVVYNALHEAFFPFLSIPFSQENYEILKRGLMYRLENTYGYGATSYYLISELNNAKNIMDKDDRFEELCRICGVAAARVNSSVWEEWKRHYQDNHEQQEENEDNYNATPIKPVSGDVARFVVLEGKDPYKVLGVSRYASHAEIKKAFYKMALQCHPDKVGEAGAETFKTANTAYGLVSTPELREEVDTCLNDTYQKDYGKVAASQCG